MRLEMNRRMALAWFGSVSILPFRKASAFVGCEPFHNEHIAGMLSGFGFRVGRQQREYDMVALVAPWCPICHTLVDDARRGVLPYNLFAIPCEPRDAADEIRIAEACLAETEDSAFALFTSRGPLPRQTLREREVALINDVQRLTLQIVRDFSQRFEIEAPNGFPSMYIAYSDGFWGASGYQREVYASATQMNIPTNLQEKFIDRLDLPMIINRTPNRRKVRVMYPNQRLRILPREDALSATCVSMHRIFETSSEVFFQGTRWFEIYLGTTALYIEHKHVEEV